LANKSTAQPLDMLEDVLVKVNQLIFPIDFYILDMQDEHSRHISTLIMGRLFLIRTSKKIDVYLGLFSMEVGEEVI